MLKIIKGSIYKSFCKLFLLSAAQCGQALSYNCRRTPISLLQYLLFTVDGLIIVNST